MVDSLILPFGVTSAILLPLRSVNQIRLSGAVMMPQGVAFCVGTASDGSKLCELGSKRAILLAADSVIHIFPSGPVTMPHGALDVPSGSANRSIVPSGFTRPTYPS